MGRLFVESVTGDASKTYVCKCCLTPLAAVGELVSRAFFSRSGPAYLFNVARNLAFDPPARRLMQTGEFIVSDVHCKVCGADIGWRYEGAASPEQRYKVGRIVLERAALEVEDGGGEVSDDEEVCV